MRTLHKTGQRLAALTLAAALLVPASAFADKRPDRGTSRSQTAAHVIERILQKKKENAAAARERALKARADRPAAQRPALRKAPTPRS